MPDLPISQLPNINTIPANYAELALSQDGITYKTTLASIIGLVPGASNSAIFVDANTILGNGISSALEVLNPLPGNGTEGQLLKIIDGVPTWVSPLPSLAFSTNTDFTLSGSGTSSNPLSVTNPLPLAGANGQILTSVSGNWIVSDSVGDNWGSQVVEHDTSLLGDGTIASPLRLAAHVTTTNTSGIIVGNGSPDSPLGISTLGAAVGEALVFNGTDIVWSAVSGSDANGGSDNWGSQVVEHDASLLGNGTIANPLRLNTAGASPNSIISYDGSSPVWIDPSSLFSVTAGLGLSLSGNVVEHGSASSGHTGDVIQLANSMSLAVVGLQGEGLPSVPTTNSALVRTSSGNWTYQELNTLGALPAGVVDETLRHDGLNWVGSRVLLNDGFTVKVNYDNPIENTRFVAYADDAQFASQTLNNATNTNTESYGSRAYAYADVGSGNTYDTVGGYFEAKHEGAGNAYALRLVDGSEAPNRILTCVGATGKAQWQDAPSDLPTASFYETMYFNGLEWTSSNVLQNNGSNIGIASNPSSLAKMQIVNNDESYALLLNAASGNTALASSIEGNSSTAIKSAFFSATNTGSGSAHALRLVDGSEAAGKVLACVDGFGNCSFASVSSRLTNDSPANITGNLNLDDIATRLVLQQVVVALASMGLIINNTIV